MTELRHLSSPCFIDQNRARPECDGKNQRFQKLSPNGLAHDQRVNILYSQKIPLLVVIYIEVRI